MNRSAATRIVSRTTGNVRKHNIGSSETNRRRWPRLKPAAVPFLKSVSFSQGSEVSVVDISCGGVLLETEVRLRPQMKIILKIVTTDGTVSIEGQILRCSITSLTGIPKYRAAIAFIQPFHLLNSLSAESREAQEPIHDLPTESAAQRANNTECGRLDLPTEPDDRAADDQSAVLTVVAHDGISLQDMFKMNDW
jgi:hypothetical protein